MFAGSPCIVTSGRSSLFSLTKRCSSSEARDVASSSRSDASATGEASRRFNAAGVGEADADAKDAALVETASLHLTVPPVMTGALTELVIAATRPAP